METQPGPDRRLAGRGLAEAGGQDAAHEDLFDLRRIDARAFDCGADGGGPQIRGLDPGQGSLKAAHGGAGEGADDNGIGGLGHESGSLN